MSPRVLRELAEVIAGPLSTIFERSWRTGEVPEDWRKDSVTPVFKKGKKEDPGNCRPVSLTSIPGKMMEELILGILSKHMEEKKAIRSSQHGFTKGKSCLTKLLAFYNDRTGQIDEGRAVDVVYLDFSKAFDSLPEHPHSELIRDVKTGGSVGCSDHAVVEFTVLKGTRQTRSVVRTLNFMKANLQVFKELVKRTPWEMVLRDKEAEQSWQILRDAFHRVQEVSISRCKKTSKKGKRQAWLSHDLLVKLKAKKELHRQFRQDQVSWEEYRDATRLCRDEVRKAKVRLELNLARDVNNSKKGF
ncbi:rna-directed dna polymerase from mobile element jockey- hypothetical protein [Limosa lapponica baueri]|uniref:Reverse transcriptase domain-containing protein n=1 Tax=Limosa lapponica baueri TaxID=1758121 RepID=A0A2I0TSX5_LIMLA|nr:rna-directed dna polymerase from mobile element jockey- hypothetical protein [Limosa lapponica baueri]